MTLPFERTLVLSVPVSLALSLAGCGPGADKPAAGPVEVGVVTLSAGPVTLDAQLTGRTVAMAVADVRPQVDGIVLRRLFEEGAQVRAGQPLYQIDARSYRAAALTAQGQLENAQAAYVTAHAKAIRYGQLGDTQAVSKQALDDTLAAAKQAQGDVHQYQGTLGTARINLTYTQVRAPISGRIGRSAITAGALVSAAQTTPLATIQQLDPIYVDIAQSSTDLLRLRQALAAGGMVPAHAAARLTLEDGTTYPLSGSVEFSEVMVDKATGSVTLRAQFPNPKGLLLPGMFARVSLPQAVAQNAVLAPQQGITRDVKGTAEALVLDGANRVVQRDVVADRAIGSTWLITSGLRGGDRLIVQGTDRVKPGDAVKPVNVRLED